MARLTFNILTLFYLIYALHMVSCANKVPVILWKSSSQSIGSSAYISVTESLTSEEFENDVLKNLTPNEPLVLILNEDLSLEDFSVYKNAHNESVFANLQTLLKNKPSSMLPSVESPVETIKDFAKNRKVFELKPSDDVPTNADKSLLIYRLPNGKNRKQLLTDNDKIFGSIIDKIAAQYSAYTGIFTGEHSFWTRPEEKTNRRINRRALATDSDTYYFSGNISQCFMVYFENVTLNYMATNSTYPTGVVAWSEALKLGPDVWSTYQFVCDENSTEVAIGYKSTDGNVRALNLSLSFNTQPVNDWYLINMNVTYNLNINDKLTTADNSLALNDIWAPLGFSYHCSPSTFQLDTYNNSETEWVNLYFTNFQLQPFINTTASSGFGDPWDCVGFFTIGIWMAIFTIAIMIIILGFGIYITFIIKTMDRFDDPKGKTISVNASD